MIVNKSVDELMQLTKLQGLTFDDVTLVTQYADFLPEDTLTKSKFSRNIDLNIPFVSAAMDTVTGSSMAIAMARLGGIGVIHKNMDIALHAEAVKKVKLHSNGLIQEPVSFLETQTVEELLNYKEDKHLPFSGFPIVDAAGRVAGILTAKDLKFCNDRRLKLKDIMTSAILTAKEGTTLEDAYKIMIDKKIGKLPLLCKNGELAGLYSFHDVNALITGTSKLENLDSKYQLRCAAAISPYDFDRAEALINAGVDAIVIDTAHGHSKGVVETVKELKAGMASSVDVVAGNVGTAVGAKALADAGADAIKVGIGPGSICTTRIVCGVGIPQISAIHAASRAVSSDVPIIADGGIKQSGDVPKAIAAGASSVMMGGLLAATEESPGEKIMMQGRRFVVYRGMGSLEAMKSGKGSRERYSQGDVEDSSQLIPQGVEGRVPYRGTAGSVLHQFAGSLKFSLGYCGSKTVPELQSKGILYRVTPSGLREAHPHDIQMVKDAPNYRTV
ncbi:IMP dehydrogenase [Lentisphaera profundi]|uniref:IMP dehydrogenase n=1 Tax=Lentisphaera profundi TaxID=1658616 RepID=UPI003B66D992